MLCVHHYFMGKNVMFGGLLVSETECLGTSTPPFSGSATFKGSQLFVKIKTDQC